MARTGASITIDVTDEAVLGALDRLARAGGDTEPLLDIFGRVILTSTQRRFETETEPGGRRWARLRPRTVAERARAGYVPIHVLRRSTALYQSLTHEVSAQETLVGTNLRYAAVHQFGGSIDMPERSQTIYRRYDKRTDELSSRFVSRRKANVAFDTTVKAHKVSIPARPYLGIDADDRRELIAAGEAHLARVVGPAATGGAS